MIDNDIYMQEENILNDGHTQPLYGEDTIFELSLQWWDEISHAKIEKMDPLDQVIWY